MKLELIGPEGQANLSAAIAGAIRTRLPLVFGYKNEVRYVQPHALGKNGKLRAYQLHPEQGWRLFDLAKISIPSFEPAPLYVKGDKDLIVDGIIAEV